MGKSKGKGRSGPRYPIWEVGANVVGVYYFQELLTFQTELMKLSHWGWEGHPFSKKSSEKRDYHCWGNIFGAS